MLKYSIRYKALPAVVLMTVLCTLASCLGSNDDNETITYDDTAMTGFTLNTVKRVYTVKASDGVTDSTYSRTFTATGYSFSIDQLTREIYNADSLPLHTDATRALCTITTKNGGSIVYVLKNSAGEDSLATYSSTDSVDLSAPLQVRIYNMSGTAYRQYTVKVNIHQQDSLAFAWNRDTVAGLEGIGARKILEKDGQLYIFGSNNGHMDGFKKGASGWQHLNMNTDFEGDAYENIIVNDSLFYTFFAGYLYSSEDGEQWTRMATPNNIGRLLGTSPLSMYALGVDGTSILSSKDGGTSWTNDVLDDDAAELPTENISLVYRQSRTNEDTYNVFMIGTRNGQTKIWSRLEEANSTVVQPWTYYNGDSWQQHRLPTMDNQQVVVYNDGLLALGGDFSHFYFSQDDGLTWFTDTTYIVPDDFTGTVTPFALFSGSSNLLYLSKAASGQVLSARLAFLGWKKNDKSVVE